MTTIDALKYNEDERVRQSGLWYCRFYQNRIDIPMIAYEHVSALKLRKYLAQGHSVKCLFSLQNIE